MPRNSSGVYSLPAGNPVVTNTTISSVWANTTLDDLATAMTDSLSRSGDGGMLAQFLAVAGTVGAPGISFSLEPTSGLYRNASNDLRMAIAGVDMFQFGASRATVHGTAPALELDEGDAAANNQRWDFVASGEALLGRALLDDGTPTTWLSVQRTAGTIDSVAFSATAFGFGGSIVITSTAPRLELLESDAAADNQRWDFAVSAEQLSFRALTDAGVAVAWLTVDRTSGTPESLTFLINPTIDNATTAALSLNGTAIRIIAEEDGQAANEGRWRMDVNTKIWTFETVSDDNASQRNIISATRGTGVALTSISIGNTTDTPLLNLRCAVVEFEDGTEALPVITNSGDENTGFYFPSADDIWFSLGGTGYGLGYRNIPPVTTNVSYELVMSDAGKMINKRSGGSGETITIPANSGGGTPVAFPVGTVITIVNQGGGTLTIAITTDTLTWAATGGTGSRILADDGIATIIKTATTEWLISGTGLS